MPRAAGKYEAVMSRKEWLHLRFYCIAHGLNKKRLAKPKAVTKSRNYA